MQSCLEGCSRRRLIGFAGAAVVTLVPALVPGEARAFRRWCRSDPVFRIDGQIAHVRIAARVSSRREARRLSTGPIAIRVQVPAGVPAEFKAMDNGFGYWYDVELVEAAGAGATDHTPVEVHVNVPMKKGGIRIRASFQPVGRGSLAPAANEGSANEWLVLQS